MVVLKCARCMEVIIDTKGGINRVTKIEEYSLVFRDEIGKFELEPELNRVKYLCNYCGHEINTEKLKKLGIDIDSLIDKIDK